MRWNPLFRSGMVLQAGKPIRFFGEGKGCGSITLDGQTVRFVSDGESWLAELPARKAGGPYTVTADLDGTVSHLTDVWIGDVYLLAGQSNHQMRLEETNYPRDAYAAHPLVRLYSAERPEEGAPFGPADGWVASTAENAPLWPALGYIIGDRLWQRKGTAVGLVACFQGAADIQSFLPESVFVCRDLCVPMEERFDNQYPWNQGTSQLWHSMVKPLFPFSLAGVIYYQGESNCSEKESRIYARLLTLLLATWREGFRDPALRFILVQIADFLLREGIPWRTIQEAQASVGAQDPHADVVVSRDVSENDLIHPVSKTRLAERIAALL